MNNDTLMDDREDMLANLNSDFAGRKALGFTPWMQGLLRTRMCGQCGKTGPCYPYWSWWCEECWKNREEPVIVPDSLTE